ncbi:hypothetical protein OROHE_010979 [Orobanche hederae]
MKNMISCRLVLPDIFFPFYLPSSPVAPSTGSCCSFHRSVLPGTTDVIPYVDADLRKIDAKVLDKAKETYTAKNRYYLSIIVNDVMLKVVDGDARNILCEAVEKHHDSVLVVGSHGY